MVRTGQVRKNLTTMYWMGCIVAVYDYVVQVKVQGPRVKTRAWQGAKRRGKRSGSRSTGKRRRLVPARPPPPEPVCHQVMSPRASYLADRREAYLGRLFVRIRSLEPKVSDKSNFVDKRLKLYLLQKKLMREWCLIRGRVLRLGSAVARIYLNMELTQQLGEYRGCDQDIFPGDDSDDGIQIRVIAPTLGQDLVGRDSFRGPTPRVRKTGGKTRHVKGKPPPGKGKSRVLPERKRKGQVAKISSCEDCRSMLSGRLCMNHRSK